MDSCKTCKFSRQCCNKAETSLVGCTMIYPDKTTLRSNLSDKKVDIIGEGNIFKGWFYNNRKVGDISERSDIGAGAMVNGILLEHTQCCSLYEKVSK